MLSGSQPAALSGYARQALVMDDELAASARRLATLAPALAADVARFAGSSAVVDRWVGRVGSAFATADDGPTWVDRLSDREATSVVLALGRELAPSLRSLPAGDRRMLASTFFPLWLRVRTLWPAAVMTASACASLPVRPAGVDEALEVLTFPDRSRRTDVVTGFLDGLVLGEFDQRGFDNPSAEWARAIGHAISGFFVVGDVRDLVADVVHGDALGALLDALALVPVAGDALKVGREGVNLADSVHDASRLSDVFAEGRPAASDLARWADRQGWVRRQTATGPLIYEDENGIKRMLIKRGSARTPGSEGPHVELRDASGQRIDPWGLPVTKHAPGNHTPIEWDLPR